ncbi:MAG: prepilin-type N-terminal cleavage/methylation domain-containing protein [Verrucomicrobia bacterium]|nr:prepilin-type N-terminal cleavage/methylation domain-containing protein [Verrucomicrobiota bacterium]
MKTRMKRSLLQAFTLVELLVVLTVLAVLVAILLPAAGRGAASARRLKCISNLRQLGIAAQLYTNDSGGRLFRWRGEASGGGRRFWFGWLQNGIEGERSFDLTQGALHPYLGSKGVEVCPAMNYVKPKLKLKATGASYGYGYNIELSARDGEPLLDAARIPSPSRIVLFGDSGQVNTFQAPASRENPMLEEFYYLSVSEATGHFRHTGTANAVYCDGHAGQEKPLAGSLDNRIAGELIGRLMPEVLRID